MKITEKLIDKISDLSMLEFVGTGRESIREDLQRMLDFVESLNEVDTENTEPLIHMTQEINRLDADIVKGELSKEEALKNAPDADSEYFRVPKYSKKSN